MYRTRQHEAILAILNKRSVTGKLPPKRDMHFCSLCLGPVSFRPRATYLPGSNAIKSRGTSVTFEICTPCTNLIETSGFTNESEV